MGHSYNRVSRASLIPTNKFELLECHAAVNLVNKEHLDKIDYSDGALEVLAQFLVGLSLSAPLDPSLTYRIVKKAFPYKNLTKEFDETLDFVSTGGYSLSEYGKFHQIVKALMANIDRQTKFSRHYGE